MRNLSKTKEKKGRRVHSALAQPKFRKVLGDIRVGTLRIGTRKLSVPGFMAALNGPEDLNALLMREIPRQELHGVVVSQHYADKIRLAWDEHDKEAIAQEGVKWRDFKKDRVILYDPIPELFYLAKPNLRKRMSEMSGAPKHFFSQMANVATSNHVSLWNEVLQNADYLALLTWQMNLQNYSSVVTPLTPFIDGTPSSVTANLEANKQSSTILRDILGVSNAFYFGINYGAFKTSAVTDTIFSGLYSHFQTNPKPDAIIVRIRNLPDPRKEDKAEKLEYFAGFLQSMGTIGSEFDIPLFLFNGGSYGLAAIEYGFCSFSERLNGNLHDPVDPPDPDEESPLIPKPKQYSTVYHPEQKINLVWEEYLELARTKPYPAVEFSSAPDPNDISPRSFRLCAKHYRIAARTAEIRKIIDGVEAGNPRGLAEEFQRGSKARNVEKILKNPI